MLCIQFQSVQGKIGLCKTNIIKKIQLIFTNRNKVQIHFSKKYKSRLQNQILQSNQQPMSKEEKKEPFVNHDQESSSQECPGAPILKGTYPSHADDMSSWYLEGSQYSSSPSKSQSVSPQKKQKNKKPEEIAVLKKVEEKDKEKEEDC